MARPIIAQRRDHFATNPDRHEVRPDDLLDDEELRAEMSRLMAANKELLSGIDSEHHSSDDGELEKLRAENAELRGCLDEMENAWQVRQREYESLLEEKSEVIRGLHLKLQEFKGPAAGAADQAAVDEIARMKRELDDQRRQLEEDEEALMMQLREMELAMSRERAEMARQRNEMQRLQAELSHEIEQSSRDSGLRERLLAIHRRSQEPADSQPAPPAAPTSNPTTTKSRSGFFRRVFGSNP